MMDLDWTEDAVCRDIGSDLFFPETGHVDADVARICRSCPVRAECLEYALAIEGRQSRWYRAGIYGGLSANQRARLASAPEPTQEAS